MKKKLVSVKDYENRTGEITEEHLYLLTYYITVMNSEYALSEVRPRNVFLRNAKRKTNAYGDFLSSEVFKVFKDTYSLNENDMFLLYEMMQKRVKFQT